VDILKSTLSKVAGELASQEVSNDAAQQALATKR
jgi:hypothetical protein